MRGEDAAVKGKFAFLFRRPGLGRVEAVDPIGRTAFLMIFREDRAYFVVPGKKVYAEEAPEVLMKRFLGVCLPPDEAVRLLTGTWGTSGARKRTAGAWSRTTGDGPPAAARRLRIHGPGVFPGDGVPRDIGLEGPGDVRAGESPQARLQPAAAGRGFRRDLSPRLCS